MDILIEATPDNARRLLDARLDAGLGTAALTTPEDVFLGSKGSHRDFLHPNGLKITLSGNPGDDAKSYQEKAVKQALEEVRK